MHKSLTAQHNVGFLIPPDADKDTRSRLTRFVDWMQHEGRAWYELDLARYRDYLLRVGGNDGNGLVPASVSAHLATIRGRYKQLLRDPQVKARLYQTAAAQLQGVGCG